MLRCIILMIVALGWISVCAQDGALLFKQKCAACHRIGKGRFVGPDLKDVHLRRDSIWRVNFIRSSQSTIKAGDTEAINLFNQFNKVVMPDQNVTDGEITALFAYIKSFSAPETVETRAKEAEKAEQKSPSVQIVSKKDIEPSVEERSQKQVIFFNKGAIISLLALAILFAVLNLVILKVLR